LHLVGFIIRIRRTESSFFTNKLVSTECSKDCNKKSRRDRNSIDYQSFVTKRKFDITYAVTHHQLRRLFKVELAKL